MAIPPDAAAIHAADRARSAFEGRRPLTQGTDLAAGITAMGREALAEVPLLAARDGETASLGEGWRFAVLDDPEPEAVLFADRTVFVSRGALAALPGEPALRELFRAAATTFASGAFRPGTGGELAEQPLSLVLPVEPAPESPGEGAANRDRWLDLLDGLIFGHPAEYGVAEGPDLLLPRADVRISLSGSGAFEPLGRGVFRATRGGTPLGLMVREIPAAEAPDAATDEGAGGNGVAAHRYYLEDLSARLHATADCHGAEATFVEVFRVRGFTAVRGRFHPAANGEEAQGADGGSGGDRALEDCGEVPGVVAVSGPGAPAGLVALFRSQDSLVEVSLDCGRRRFGDCEALFLEVLGSADRLWDTPVPGPLRITAVTPGEGGSVRDALRRLASEGRMDAPLAAVEFLNRGWLDETLGPGERVFILSRSRPGSAPDAGGREP